MREKGRIMSGTRAGGLKASKTNKEKHGDDFFRNIGRKGGSAKHKTRWLQEHPEFAQKIGKIGGTRSKRGKAKKNESVECE